MSAKPPSPKKPKPTPFQLLVCSTLAGIPLFFLLLNMNETVLDNIALALSGIGAVVIPAGIWIVFGRKKQHRPDMGQ